MVRHLADIPQGGEQRCVWCHKVLMTWPPELNTATPETLFWKPMTPVIEDGAAMFRWYGVVQIECCCVPEVESVDIQ